MRNVPLVLTDPIPGCETKNAAFFESHGWRAWPGAKTPRPGAISLAKDAVAIEAMLGRAAKDPSHAPCRAR